MNTQHIDVELGQWAQVVREARDEGANYFDFLTAVDATDDPENPGFDVICHLMELVPESAPRDVFLRTRVPQEGSLPSITGVFSGAAWHERETHEMFGLPVGDFEDGSGLGLRPLLLPEGFEGFPLRKEFVLAARSRPWPGAKEPGESSHEASPAPAASAAPAGRRARRRVQAPGVPGPEWGPRTLEQVLAEPEPQAEPEPEVTPEPATEQSTPPPPQTPASEPDAGEAE